MLASSDLPLLAVAAVAFGLLTSACIPSTQISGTTATAPPNSSEAVPSTVTSSPSSDVAELEVSSEQLAPGTYTRSDFEPDVTFSVSGEWFAVQMALGFFDIQKDVGSLHVIAVQFANVDALPGRNGATVPLVSAAEAAAVIESNPDLIVLDRSGSRIDGRNGFVVEVENAAQTRAVVLLTPAGALSIDPGRRLWIAFFDTEEGVLAIMVGGSAELWEDALLAAEPVLETVTIGN
jgi:hypothetical protein